MAQIIRMAEGDELFVPGTDPEQIIKDGNQFAGDDSQKVTTAPEDVRIGWYRVNPCRENSCWDGGGHSGHWEPTRHQTRGGFQGAVVSVGWNDVDGEVTS